MAINTSKPHTLIGTTPKGRTLRTILSAYPRFSCVSEDCDGEETLTSVQVRSLGGGAVMDIQMPRSNGIPATALIKRFSGHVIVVGLLVHATRIAPRDDYSPARRTY